MKPSLKVLRRQQTYNAFVDNEAIEDYSLRYAASSFRRWPEWVLANTALGGASFLALEAIGALLVIDYGFTNSTLAILTVAAVIIVTGLPIAYYTSRYNVDIDLLTRGAGFGYLGSTITSLIYASYTIIFFAIEAAIMAKALQLGFGMPVSVGYLLSSIIIIPLVFYGITAINGLQFYTQPIWIILSVLPFLYILAKHPDAVGIWTHFSGVGHRGDAFDPLLYGSAMSVGFALISQIGEQADYLRFLPDKTPANRVRWWAALASAGPGWIVPGGIKLLCGSFLAVFFISRIGYSRPEATDPVHLYLLGFSQVFHDPGVILAVTVLFVIVCQVKINVTNAYAGSLAWSNFFSRIAHSHPGRAIWIILNIVLAILIMQFGVLYILNTILLVYAMFAMAWIGAIFADLAILKPLGVSPAHIEFKRAHLHNINPVGFGGMLLGFAAALMCHFGWFGLYLKAFSALVALGVSIAAALSIAAATRGRFYLAREAEPLEAGTLLTCTSCNKEYEPADIVLCPAYGEYVCSLCCSLDSVCKGICKRSHGQEALIPGLASGASPHRWRRLKIFGVYFGSIAGVLAVVFALIYAYFAVAAADGGPKPPAAVFLVIFVFVLVIIGMWTWWFSLIQEYRLNAEGELDKYINELESEVKKRQVISAALAETEKLQRLILENATIGIAYVKNGYTIWKNKRFSIYGDVDEEKRDCCVHVGAIFKDDDIYENLVNDPKRQSVNGKRITIGLPSKNGEGHSRWFILSINAVDPERVRDGSIWLLNDITEHKLAEDNLRMSEDRLRELNESLESQVRSRTEELKKSYESIRQADKMASLGILVSGMAHEINNPVSFIMLNSGIIQDAWRDVVSLMDEHYGTAPDLWIGKMPYATARTGIEKLLKGINQGAVRVSGIVRNLKEYAKQTPLDMTGDVDINKALETSLELLSNELRKATNTLRVDTSPVPVFKGDLLRIEQVLVNLIQNAYQALRDRSQAISIRTFEADDLVFFEIADQGRGISRDDLDHVLDPFFTTKRDRGGTGLGLSVSAGIVEEHGGALNIESVPDKGTRVVLTFPVAARP